MISYILSSGFVYRPINVGQVLSFGLECNLNVHIIQYFTLECSYTLNFVNNIDDLKENEYINIFKIYDRENNEYIEIQELDNNINIFCQVKF